MGRAGRNGQSDGSMFLMVCMPTRAAFSTMLRWTGYPEVGEHFYRLPVLGALRERGLAPEPLPIERNRSRRFILPSSARTYYTVVSKVFSHNSLLKHSPQAGFRDVCSSRWTIPCRKTSGAAGDTVWDSTFIFSRENLHLNKYIE